MLHDIRDGFRSLRANPGFAIVALLTLALGIGMTTAIFSVVNAVLLRPVPFPDMDRLVVVWETDRASGTTHEPASLPDFLDFRQRSRSVADFAAFIAGEANLNLDNGDPSRVATLNVTERFLPMLGITPAVGRVFTADEDKPGGGNVVLISEALWQRQFQRDPNIVGKSVRLNDRPRTIVGVVPASADFGILQVLRAADYGQGFAQRDARTTVDVFAPLQGDPQRLPRSTHPLFIIGRLAQGASVESAQQELGAIAVELEKTFPDDNEARGVAVQGLHDIVFGPIQPALVVLMWAVGLVLLIACVNVAHLLLARGVARVREIAVRSALGAGTARLARQHIVENTLLLVLASALGVLVASIALRVLLVAAPADIPRLADVAIDARVLFVVLSVAVAVGFVFGLVPLWQARRTDLQTVLKAEQGRGTTGGRDSATARSVLMAGEVAFAVVLVIGAGLLIKSFWQLQQVNPGFDVEQVVKAEFQLPGSRYPTDFRQFPNFKEILQFNASLLERASALPGVESAAIAGNHPLDAGFTNSFVVIGREAEARDWPEISVRRATPGYFPYAAAPAGSRPADRGLRHHAGGAGRAHQRSGGREVFRQAGSHRPADGYLWHAPNDRRGRGRREDSRAEGSRTDCGVSADVSGALLERDVARARARRSGSNRLGDAIDLSRGRPFACRLRRRAASRHARSVHRRAAVHDAPRRRLRRARARALAHRHSRRAQLRRPAAAKGDWHSSRARRRAWAGCARRPRRGHAPDDARSGCWSRDGPPLLSSPRMAALRGLRDRSHNFFRRDSACRGRLHAGDVAPGPPGRAG